MNNNKKLLLIENQMADQASSFSLFLQRQNGPYELTSVTSLIDAEKYLLAEPFDLILLDHLLCSDSNLSISKFFQQIPVILIAENGDDDGGIKMMRQGIDDFLCRDREGKYCALLSVSIDKALARQVNLKTQRDVTKKNEPLQRLTAALAHDLSNMLSPILGFSQMLLDETENNNPHFELIEEIHTSASRAKNLVRQLSLFMDKNAGKFKNLNLIDILQDFYKILQSTLSDNVSLDLRLQTSVPPIEGDIALIEQAVMNLCLYLQDAIQYTGRVSLSMVEVRIDDENEFCKEATCEIYLVLKAEATGNTGEDEQLKKGVLWQYKHRVEPGEKLAEDPGLALVQAIVKQHDGFIRFNSDKNTVGIELFFPVSDKPLPRAVQPDIDKARQPCCESILLVESNLPVKKLITAVLQQKGYTVHTAETEEDAYEIASKGQEKVDLLLADTAILEPENNRVFTSLERYNTAIKAFYMAPSNQLNASVGSGSKTRSVEQLIYKPFALNQLTECVRKALDSRG